MGVALTATYTYLSIVEDNTRPTWWRQKEGRSVPPPTKLTRSGAFASNTPGKLNITEVEQRHRPGFFNLLTTYSTPSNKSATSGRSKYGGICPGLAIRTGCTPAARAAKI